MVFGKDHSRKLGVRRAEHLRLSSVGRSCFSMRSRHDRHKNGIEFSNEDEVERRIAFLREVVDQYTQEMITIRQFDGRRMSKDVLLAEIRKFAKVDQEFDEQRLPQDLAGVLRMDGRPPFNDSRKCEVACSTTWAITICIPMSWWGSHGNRGPVV